MRALSFLVCGWFLVASVISGTSVLGGDGTAEYWEHRARHFLVQKDRARAFECMQRALHEVEQNTDHHVRLLVKLGHLYFAFGMSLGDAEGCYKKALQLDPYDFEALMGTGDLYFSRGEYLGALEFYERCGKYHPKRFEPWASIGACRYERAEWTRALNYYEKAIELNPQDTVSWNNLGNIWYDRLELSKARQAYLKALAINPAFASAHNNLGNLHLHEKRFGEARKHLVRALRVRSDDPGIHNNLANLYFEIRQVERAKHHLHQAIYFEDHPVYHNNMAVMERFSREYLAAGREYAHALRDRPDYSNARKNSRFFEGRSQKIKDALHPSPFSRSAQQ
jgi:tetratricopeptide (TPR) repeat protein